MADLRGLPGLFGLEPITPSCLTGDCLLLVSEYVSLSGGWFARGRVNMRVFGGTVASLLRPPRHPCASVHRETTDIAAFFCS